MFVEINNKGPGVLKALSVRHIAAWLTVLAAILLSACGGGGGGGDSSAGFSLRSLSTSLDLVEGDASGLNIPLDLTRELGHNQSIELSISGVTPQDSAFVNTAFSRSSLNPSIDQTSVNLTLDVGILPILEQQRRFVISASDGNTTDKLTVTVNVKPVDRPDIYLLIGQSNMVGFSGEIGQGSKQAGPGEPDEVNERIKQFNVTRNGEFDVFLTPQDYTDISKNFREPRITNAIDPLHIPVNEFTLNKAEDYIGLGLTFAKQALPATSKNIILVPAAWSGTSFCDTSIAPAHWNAFETNEPNHGNTLLFDRALARANHALDFSGGILRGILWHQGESDANTECAARYEYNLQTLAQELRARIIPDMRGTAARGPDSDVPFVVGTMSRGADSRDDLSVYSPEKNMVDQVHRNIANLVPNSAVSIHDDLIPANGYPCGNTSCIHFGTLALREMGRRYYGALRQAAEN